MFDDCSGYFKGFRTGVVRFGTVGNICLGTIPLRGRGTWRRFIRAIRAPAMRTTAGPKKQHSVRRDRNRAPRDRGRVAHWHYMRSIMALPKPEHDTWVDPGMSRAKS